MVTPKDGSPEARCLPSAATTLHPCSACRAQLGPGRSSTSAAHAHGLVAPAPRSGFAQGKLGKGEPTLRCHKGWGSTGIRAEPAAGQTKAEQQRGREEG